MQNMAKFSSRVARLETPQRQSETLLAVTEPMVAQRPSHDPEPLSPVVRRWLANAGYAKDLTR